MRLGKFLSSSNKPELENLKEKCNFTEEEEAIMKLLIANKSYEQISTITGYSTATVGRRIKDLRLKIEQSSAEKIPVWKKCNITIEEASEYSSIGISKIYSMINDPSCPFALRDGEKRLIKRKEFEMYFEKIREV